MRYTALLALLAATVVSAKDIAVTVGGTSLTYTPSSVNAGAGDVITFTFAGGLHSVTQSTFSSPCAMAGDSAFDSGFVPGSSSGSATFKLTVNDSSPVWVYCRQSGHCQAGMVFAVNPTADQTFAQFQSNAKNGVAAGSSSSSSGATASTSTSSGSSSTSAKTSSSSSSSTTAVTSTSPSTGSGSSSGAAATSTGYKSNAIVNANMNIAGLLAVVGAVAGFVI